MEVISRVLFVVTANAALSGRCTRELFVLAHKKVNKTFRSFHDMQQRKLGRDSGIYTGKGSASLLVNLMPYIKSIQPQ